MDFNVYNLNEYVDRC